MNINSISSQPLSNMTISHNTEAVNNKITNTYYNESPTPKNQNKTYDVHNMSTNDLKNLINDLRESNQISEEDSLMLSLDKIELDIFGTPSKDTQIDMVNFFEEQIEVMNSTPESRGVEFMERALNLFKMIEAKQGANIPTKV